MKKIIALSLTFALAGGLATTINTTSKNIENCTEYNACALEFSEINKDLIIGEGFAVMHQNGKFNVVPKKPANLVVDNGNTTTDGNGLFNNQNQTNNLSNNTSGTSPYGIGNANSGVLPNKTNSTTTTLPRQNNLDSMVRTNNIDTYKNRTSQNLDGTYDNNGNKIANNSGINANYTSPTNTNQTIQQNAVMQNQNTIPQNTAGINKTTQPQLTQQNQTINQSSGTQNMAANQTQNNAQNLTQTNTKTTALENKAKATQTATQNSTIENLQTQLTEQKEKFNTKIQNINNMLNKIDGGTISLNGDQATKMNGYLDVIEKLSHKLMQTHSFVTLDVENFWNNSKFNPTDANSPYYLEIKSQLGTRIICFDCLNEALDNVAKILEEYSNTTEQTKNEITA